MTERVILTRKETGDEGTFGTIAFRGNTLHTGELPWRDNAVGKSCIPSGVYQAKMEPSPRFGRNCYELQDVPGRTQILIHSGNFCGDTSCGKKSHVEGCILLGEARDALDGQKAVLTSRRAVATFEALMGREPFEIEIIDATET